MIELATDHDTFPYLDMSIVHRGEEKSGQILNVTPGRGEALGTRQVNLVEIATLPLAPSILASLGICS